MTLSTTAETLATLKAAREYVKRGWTQGALARDADGAECAPLSPGATCWCPEGAICAVAPGELSARNLDALQALQRAAGRLYSCRSVHRVNDTRCAYQGDALGLFDEAIRSLEATP